MSRQVDSSAFIRYINDEVTIVEVVGKEWITQRSDGWAQSACPLLFMKASDGRRNETTRTCLVERVTLFAVEG